MPFQTNYSLTGDRSKEQGTKLMKLFAERGKNPGEIAHYIHADGSGGSVISDNKDIAELHDVTLAYAPYMEFEIIPIRMVDEAVGDILKYYS